MLLLDLQNSTAVRFIDLLQLSILPEIKIQHSVLEVSMSEHITKCRYQLQKARSGSNKLIATNQ